MQLYPGPPWGWGHAVPPAPQKPRRTPSSLSPPHPRDPPEPLLPGRVPELQLHPQPRLQLHELDVEVYPHRLVDGVQEDALGVTPQQRGLPHRRVPQHDHPELVLPPRLHRHRELCRDPPPSRRERVRAGSAGSAPPPRRRSRPTMVLGGPWMPLRLHGTLGGCLEPLPQWVAVDRRPVRHHGHVQTGPGGGGCCYRSSDSPTPKQLTPASGVEHGGVSLPGVGRSAQPWFGVEKPQFY